MRNLRKLRNEIGRGIGRERGEGGIEEGSREGERGEGKRRLRGKGRKRELGERRLINDDWHRYNVEPKEMKEEESLNLTSAIWFAWGVLLNSGIGQEN